MTPRKITVKTEIQNSKFIENRDLIVDAINVYEGKRVTVTIERFYKKRSNKQNRYYWGVIVEHWRNLIRTEWGEIWQTDEVHDFLKCNLNSQVFVDEQTGELALNPLTNEVIRKPKSTTKNTTFSQEEYHEACRQLAWEMFQANIPLPNEEEESIQVTY